MKNNKLEIIDIGNIIRRFWEKKKVFLIVLPSVFLLSCIYIFSQPRTYSTSLKLAPEIEGNSSVGGLSSIAASFGIDLNSLNSTDAISPLLYPDLLEDNKFISSLFNVKVTTQDGELTTTYYDYLDKHQKVAWTSKIFGWINNLFPEGEPKEIKATGKKGKFDPYFMSKHQNDIAGAIRNSINITIDKRTAVITVSSTDQDPYICKAITDSVMMKLRDAITNYRTNKARRDVEYYTEVTAEAKHDYEKARQLYGSYSDANLDMMLESFKAKQNDLENEMQLKFNAYSSFSAQLQNAKSKVIERTPAFTILKGAPMPVKPTGPKRIFFIAGTMLIATFLTAVWVTKDILLGALKQQEK